MKKDKSFRKQRCFLKSPLREDSQERQMIRWWALNRKSHKAKEPEVIDPITKVEVIRLSEENPDGNSAVLRKTKVYHIKCIAITIEESVVKSGMMVEMQLNSSSKDTVRKIKWKPPGWEKRFIKQIPEVQSRIYMEFQQKSKQHNLENWGKDLNRHLRVCHSQ